MRKIECPYCEEDCDHDPEQNEEDVTYEMECPYCENTFVFTVNYYPSFSAEKAPCLNGEPHKWNKIAGCPEEYFKNKRRCEHCDKEITVGGSKEGKGDE